MAETSSCAWSEQRATNKTSSPTIFTLVVVMEGVDWHNLLCVCCTLVRWIMVDLVQSRTDLAVILRYMSLFWTINQSQRQSLNCPMILYSVLIFEDTVADLMCELRFFFLKVTHINLCVSLAFCFGCLRYEPKYTPIFHSLLSITRADFKISHFGANVTVRVHSQSIQSRLHSTTTRAAKMSALLNQSPPKVSALYIETDLEPDDLLAIYILLKRGFSIHHIVVGEGDAFVKYERMLMYWAMLHDEFPTLITKEPHVLRGGSSSKPFSQDGADISEDSSIVAALQQRVVDAKINDASDTTTELEIYKKHLVSYLEQETIPVLIMLKPMRELLATWKNIPELLRSKTILVDYGSFNYRCLFGKNDNSNANDILEMLLTFKQHTLYESFLATGSINSIHHDNASLLYKALHNCASSSPFVRCLLRLIHNWNTHLIAQCRANVTKYNTLAQDRPLVEWQIQARERSEKIIASIEPAVHTQMVLADSGLALMFNHPTFAAYRQPIKMSFDNNYTKAIPCEDNSTSTYAFLDVPFSILDVAFSDVLNATVVKQT